MVEYIKFRQLWKSFSAEKHYSYRLPIRDVTAYSFERNPTASYMWLRLSGFTQLRPVTTFITRINATNAYSSVLFAVIVVVVIIIITLFQEDNTHADIETVSIGPLLCSVTNETFPNFQIYFFSSCYSIHYNNMSSKIGSNYRTISWRLREKERGGGERVDSLTSRHFQYYHFQWCILCIDRQNIW